MSTITPITFTIHQPGQAPRQETLAQAVIKVGKLASSHVRVDDEQVSRMHAVVEVTGQDSAGKDEVVIIDLGSASGTFVNGKKVTKAQLKSGDEITLGSARVTVQVGSASATTSLQDVAEAHVTPAALAPAPPVPAVAAKRAPKPPAAPNPFGRAALAALPNPFATSRTETRRSLSAEELEGIDPEKLTYGIVASGPPVDANEVESGERALEVMVMWGRTVLHVDHLKPARSFYVGESAGKSKTADEGVDYLISPELLGAARMPICLADEGSLAMVFPEGASGEVTLEGQTTAIESIQLKPCPEVPGAQQYAVPEGATVRVHWKGFTFVAKPVRAGKRIASGFALDWAPLGYAAAVLALVAALMVVMYFSPPSVAGLNNDVIDPNSRLAQFVIQPAETEAPPETPAELSSDGGGAEGGAEMGEEGAAGDEASPVTDNRYALRGDAAPEDQQLSRPQMEEVAATTGAIGALASLASSLNMPTSVFGAEQAIGADEINALGALTGANPGNNFGVGGLGLSGTGRHGGGQVFGSIGTDIGTVGGAGTCRGSHCRVGGWGSGPEGTIPGHTARVPAPITGRPAVSGSLSADVIRRVVRRHLNEVRFCYEQGLNSQPDLAGTVSVRWIISPSGSVTTSTVAGSNIGSARVDSCVASAVRRWTFPAPDMGGMVSVTYPFTLRTQ